MSSTGVGFYPLSLLEWFVNPWPAFLAPVLTGIASLLAILSFRSCVQQKSLVYRIILFAPLGLLLVSMIGLIRTTEWDNALLFLWHILGLVNFVSAVYIHIVNDRRVQDLILSAVAIGTLLSVCSGVYQIKYGFKETRLMALKMAQQEGRKLSPAMQSRLSQQRVFASFTYPNNYAAHLILTLPITFMMVWRFGGNFHPKTTSRIVLLAIALATSGAILLHTGSRSAVAALAIAGLCSCVVLKYVPRRGTDPQKRIVFLVGAVVLCLFLVAMYVVFKGRSFASVEARFGYYSAAWKMFLSQPLTGVGLGEFFPHYIRLKPPDAEETRLTHNLLLFFLSQCGIAAGIVAACFILQPMFTTIAACRNYRINSDSAIGSTIAIIFGTTAWSLHSLTDFNVQIPGTLYLYAALPIVVLAVEKNTESEQLPVTISWKIFMFIPAIIGIAALHRAPGERAYQVLYNKARATQGQDVPISEVRVVAEYLPHSVYPWDLYGKYKLSRGEIKEALPAFVEATRRVPHRAAYHAYLAQCHHLLGDKEFSCDSINEALQWYPHQPEFSRMKSLFCTD